MRYKPKVIDPKGVSGQVSNKQEPERERIRYLKHSKRSLVQKHPLDSVSHGARS